jgi:hypothetical protein
VKASQQRPAGVARAKSVRIPRPLAASEHGLFFGLLKRDGILLPETEFVFASPRKWRFDFAWPSWDVAVEVEGAVWTRGRHTRGKGFIADMEKYNEAAVRGWKVIRVTPQQLCTLETIALIKRALTPIP